MAIDWRGTEIVEGATVIYGAPVSRSIVLVEGEVVGFTKSGRVNVRIVRRAYGSVWRDGKEVVHVGADRLTIVTELPPTDLPTFMDKKAEAQAKHEAYMASSHVCTRCGAEVQNSDDKHHHCYQCNSPEVLERYDAHLVRLTSSCRTYWACPN